MNVRPGGKQRRIHPTTIPHNNPHPELRGTRQTMVFDEDLPPNHPHYKFRGQPKGMRVVLEERGLWDALTQANGGKEIPGDCKECKMTLKAKQDRALQEAAQMAGQDEPEEMDGSFEGDVYVSNVTGSICCMHKVLSEQDNFLTEKPLLQLIIERAGHKCYFLPKFHCELNPIEMYWGWVKNRTCGLLFILLLK